MKKLGIYVRGNHEVVITSRFKIHLYKYFAYYGCSLYKDDKLICIIHRELGNQKESSWAFLNNLEQIISNSQSLKEMINSLWDENYQEKYELKDKIYLKKLHLDYFVEGNKDNIKECLSDWAKGSRFEVTEDRIYFYIQTNLVQYQISVKSDGDIYCGARYIVFVDNGLYMGTQYFRIRNFLDNKALFCWWRCYLGDKFWKTKFLDTKDKYYMVSEYDGMYLLLKECNENKIVLFAGIDDEVSYTRGRSFVERFE